ncbi:ADP-ribosylation factor-binding protein GGA1 [Triplophysa tibetana]|uniref:ADP-ribosylation factor-binding protein GGA1 n=1 Tax=Triplophysa tibetana TaxID=1572043 RepID=A0A5A9NWI7_9TELE|nr:ADP-ribosylation factor-binding protein GGA1 [Triplophysa tibetana]
MKMAAPPEEHSLQFRINKATNPLNRENDWESVQLFCDQLSNEPDGPQLATRLLAHKIQSPQEWEAMQALMVLETCVKNCGKKFHNEMGKFRFLNELIKVVSPKDPDFPDDKSLVPPLARPTNAIFEDEEKSKTLSRLLNSTHPEDLRAANKLIKEMVQEDQKRMEKVSKRVNAIKEVKESVMLLTQLLGDYSKETGSHSNDELIKDMYQRCEKMRPTLFRLASDTEDNDEALAEILQANDSLTQVINLYRQLVKGEEVNGETSSTTRLSGSSNALLDLTGLDTSPSAQSFTEFPSQMLHLQDMGASLLDDELMSLGLTEVNSNLAPSQSGDSMTWNTFQSSESVNKPVPPGPATAVAYAAKTPNNALDDLDLLGKTLLQQSLPPESLQVKWDKFQPHTKPTLRDLQIKSATTPSPELTFSSEPGAPLNLQPTAGVITASIPQDDLLANMTVPLETIKPSSMLPLTIFDKHSLRVLFHFARSSSLPQSDVLVVIISMLSSSPVPITNIRFQAAVPKTMRVKLQPPSGLDLPAFNPLLPPAAITQVLLLANPHKEKVRLRYKLTFDLGEESHDESGDVEQFPPQESWMNL